MKVSFIIPTLNRERTIDACLKSIASQTWLDKEIIVVDGGSKDKTIDIASRYVTKIVHDKGSLGEARQRGIEESTGEILGVFDSDIILPSKDWTEKALQRFAGNVGIVWPINKAPEDSSLVTKCYFLLWQVRAEKFLKPPGNKALTPGGNVLISRDAVQAAGGFDKKLKFGEDVELGQRIISLGYEVAIFEEAIIHDTMWSLREYTKKQFWGASSLMAVEISTINFSMNWDAKGVDKKKGLLAVNTFDYISQSINGMIKGLAKDHNKAWLLTPLLLTIRIIVYARFLGYRALRE